MRLSLTRGERTSMKSSLRREEISMKPSLRKLEGTPMRPSPLVGEGWVGGKFQASRGHPLKTRS